MRQAIEYEDEEGRRPFARWVRSLPSEAKLKVTVAVARVQDDNLSAAKALSGGVHELRIFWGPGLRVYVGFEGDKVVILLGGSDKDDQRRAVAAAKAAWDDYRARKRARGRR